MNLEDIATSISELPQEEAMAIIKRTRVSRHKQPERQKNRSSSRGRRKKPRSLDDIFKASTTEDSKKLLKRLEKLKRKNNG